MKFTNNLFIKFMISVLIDVQFVFASKATKTSLKSYKANTGFQEINVGYNDGLRVQDSSGDNEWSYIALPEVKRCDFRQINILCMVGTDMSAPVQESTVCQLNCKHRGFKIGVCYSEPGPGSEPSGEWQQNRGPKYCYCSYCHNDKCMQYCHNFGFATGYCHESANYGNSCKCVGCDASLCGKHCNNIYGNSLQQSLCRHNECKCLANRCDSY